MTAETQLGEIGAIVPTRVKDANLLQAFVARHMAAARTEVIEACARVAETRYEFETSGLPDRCFDLQVLAQRNAGRIIASAIRAQVEREGE